MRFFTDGGSKDDYPPHGGLRGLDFVESFGFWRRKSCIKGVAVRTAETARFSGEKDESLQTALFIPCGSGDAAQMVEINESRFVMRAWAFVGRESGVRRFSQNRR